MVTDILGPKLIVLNRAIEHKFVGATHNDDNLLITYDDNITVYNTEHKKVSESWTIGKSQYFTSPAIYNSVDSEYVVVVNNHVIRTFTVDLEKGDKFTVNVPIFQLILDEQPFVVFINGVIMPLNNVLADPKKIPDSGPITSTILKAQMLSNHVLCCIVSQNNEYSIVMMNTSNQSHFTIPLKQNSLALKSSCFCMSKESFTFVSLWEDGSLCKSQISLDFIEREDIEYDRLASVTLPDTSSDNYMTSLSSDRVAVATSDNQVFVIDLKFGITHEKLNNVHAKHLELLKGHLLIVEGDSVSVCQVTPHPVTLSSVLGKHAITESGFLTEMQKKDPSQQKPVEDEDELLMNTILRSNKESRMLISWRKLLKGKNLNQRKQLVSSSFMVHFLNKLASKQQPWFPSVVLELINTELLSSKFCPSLPETIIAHKSWNILLQYFQLVRDIDEKEMVLCLSSILPADVDLMVPELEEMLAAILILPYTEKKLLEALRFLDFERAMVLLSYLGSQLTSADVFHKTSIVNQIITWMCLILDAHFSQIIMTSGSWESLLKLQQIISIQTELHHNLLEVEVILNKIAQSVSVSKKPKSFSYNIEIMAI